jgi:hypothetical protein
MVGRLGSLVSSVALSACSVIGIRSVEEPPFKLVRHVGAVEIRDYGPRVAAEAVVDGDEMESRNAGFRKIAGYIFGGNHAGESIAMTAPVAQGRAGDNGENIAMTAPVAQDRAADGQWRIAFFMPAGKTLDNLPVPNDPGVRLVAVPAVTMAVLRFSGSRDTDAIAAKQSELLGTLASGPWQPSGAPVAWFYDPPWTLPFARRNEVAVPVTQR